MATIVDWDPHTSGLRCRGGCEAIFRSVTDTVTAISLAALERDAHEAAIHRYVHQPLDAPTRKFDWGAAHRGVRPGQGS